MGETSPFAILVVQWLGVAMVFTFVYVLARAHYTPGGKINMASLIVDGEVVTLAKFGGLLALLASTWVFVLMAIKGTLTEGVFIGYVVGWGGVKVAADFTKRKAPEAEEAPPPNKREPKKDAPAPYSG